jgi:transposase
MNHETHFASMYVPDSYRSNAPCHESSTIRRESNKSASGSIAPKPHGGRSRKLDDAAQDGLLQLVGKQPDATLAQLRQPLGIICGLTTFTEF